MWIWLEAEGSTVVTDQTKEDYNQEEHHSTEDLLLCKPTQIDMEEEQGLPNQKSSLQNLKQRQYK